MSRTDVHAPSWVKARDPLWRANYVEDHNHSWYSTGHERAQDEDGSWCYRSIWARVERCDLDVFVAGLKAKGVKIVQDVFDTPVCRMAVVHDPDGNEFIIHKLKTTHA